MREALVGFSSDIMKITTNTTTKKKVHETKTQYIAQANTKKVHSRHTATLIEPRLELETFSVLD